MAIQTITSRDNPQYKQLRQLATSAQARRKVGRTLLDGVHLCEAWLQHRGLPALCVAGEGARGNPEVVSLLARCEHAGGLCIVLPDALFEPLSQVEQGVALLFVVDTPVADMSQVPLDSTAVLLDGLQDPGNLGSILRTAAAAGVPRVFCGPGSVAAWSPKVLRAGMGAHFVLDIIEDVDLQALMRSAKVPVLATSLQADASLYEADLQAPAAWLFGQEGRGVAPDLLALATRHLIIPQQPQVESLNVAASVAICLFEQRRQILARAR
jgi:TrmH family RNA methyltransferase